MLFLILNTGRKDWIQPNSDAESSSTSNTGTYRTSQQVAEDLRRIRDNYYLVRRNLF
ncbi:hypothetical protein [Scytonema sp. UIC 10036]|uniref:hypothetical protein n=1 Tax=Scytonema sp. UIC 10036 TaxID=2304196 RepID=UPI00140FB4DD|nr:hypothetical protein [Scytonema sp. UIC 10036]